MNLIEKLNREREIMIENNLRNFKENVMQKLSSPDALLKRSLTIQAEGLDRKSIEPFLKELNEQGFKINYVNSDMYVAMKWE